MKTETTREIATRVADSSILRDDLIDEVEKALNAERERERDRILSAIAHTYRDYDSGERDSVLAIPFLPACTCLAAENRVATEYQHHTNDCPVYAKANAAIRGSSH